MVFQYVFQIACQNSVSSGALLVASGARGHDPARRQLQGKAKLCSLPITLQTMPCIMKPLSKQVWQHMASLLVPPLTPGAQVWPGAHRQGVGSTSTLHAHPGKASHGFVAPFAALLLQGNVPRALWHSTSPHQHSMVGDLGVSSVPRGQLSAETEVFDDAVKY